MITYIFSAAQIVKTNSFAHIRDNRVLRIRDHANSFSHIMIRYYNLIWPCNICVLKYFYQQLNVINTRK